jgi:uncharacterized SAM-binding protein YcdF (DUF218 family)
MWAAAALAAALLAPQPLIVREDLDRPDAIVVLASHEWERIPAAADLARIHASASVVLTVSRQFSEVSCHLCGERPRWLNHLGVDGGRIVEVEIGPEDDTRGEAVAVTAEARRRGWSRLLVATSVYHTRRALWTFRKAAGQGVEIGMTSAQGHSKLRPALWWASVEDTWYVGYEWAAMVKYAVLGRLSH